jgi:hypothetical protein
LSGDPLASATRGAVGGGLDWSSEKISELVERFLNRELAFVEDKKNIETVKKQREAEEYKLLQQYIPKGYLRILCQMGLALREMENDQNRMQQLKDTIHGKYRKAGVHIAELVQIRVVTQLLARLVTIYGNHGDIEKTLTSFLMQIDDLALFVSKEDEKRVERLSRLVMDRVDNNPTHMMIVFGRALAKRTVLKILKKIKDDDLDYTIEVQDEGFQLSAFVFGPELKKKITHWSDPLATQSSESKRGA